jgi:hypothetical protein
MILQCSLWLLILEKDSITCLKCTNFLYSLQNYYAVSFQYAVSDAFVADNGFLHYSCVEEFFCSEYPVAVLTSLSVV